MTSGERAVWAAEFVRVMAMPDGGRTTAVRSATSLVMILRDIKSRQVLNPEEQAMVEDMLGVPR